MKDLNDLINENNIYDNNFMDEDEYIEEGYEEDDNGIEDGYSNDNIPLEQKDEYELTEKEQEILKQRKII